MRVARLFAWLAVVAVVIAAAQPSIQAPPRERVGILEVVVDRSGSTLATDLAPTRLDAIRQATLALLDRVPEGVQVGLVAFSDEARTLAPSRPDLAGPRQPVPPDPALLAAIAGATGGRAVEARSTPALHAALDDLGSDAGVPGEPRELALLFAAVALLLLAVGSVLSPSRRAAPGARAGPLAAVRRLAPSVALLVAAGGATVAWTQWPPPAGPPQAPRPRRRPPPRRHGRPHRRPPSLSPPPAGATARWFGRPSPCCAATRSWPTSGGQRPTGTASTGSRSCSYPPATSARPSH